MRAVGFAEFGGPQVLGIVELPEPSPGRGEAVIRVRAATVNPTDMLMRSGQQLSRMVGLNPPYVCGVEFAGHVHALGKDVGGLQLGQAVMGVVNSKRPGGGAHAQYVCVPAASLAPVPEGVELASAATIPMNGLTARMCIEALALPAGSTILVTGGAGALGGYVIQLAREAGLCVIADARPSDAAQISATGAQTIVPRGDGMVAAIRQLHPKGVDGLVDGALLKDKAAAAVRDGGTAVALRGSDLITDPRLRNRSVSVFDQAENAVALSSLSEALRKGILTPRIARVLPMTEAVEAHRLVEAGGLRGRVVLAF